MGNTYLNFAKIRDESTGCRSKVSILQDAADTLTMILKDSAGVERSYWILIKKCSGMAWKLNKKSISNDAGSAADMIDFLANPEHGSYLRATIKGLIFSGNIKAA